MGFWKCRERPECAVYTDLTRGPQIAGHHEMSGGVLSGEDVGAKLRRFLPLPSGHNPGTIRTDGLGEGLPVFPKLLTPV